MSVDASGGCERMVTVLASDGYTCVTTKAAESGASQRRQQEHQHVRRLPGEGARLIGIQDDLRSVDCVLSTVQILMLDFCQGMRF